MSEKPFKSATQMDEELAEFTDKVLNGEPAGEADVEELRSLQAVVSKLKASSPTPPSQEVMRRIENKLRAEWQAGQPLRNPGQSLGQKMLQAIHSLTSQPRQMFALTFVIIFLLVLFLVPFNQLVASSIEATAGNSDQSQWFIFIAALVVVIGLIWFGRKKS